MTRGGNTRKTGARYELLGSRPSGKMWLSYHREKLSLPDRGDRSGRLRRGVSGICGGQIPQKQQEGRCGSGRIHSKAENDQPRGRLLYESSRICADQSVRFDVVAFDGEEMELTGMAVCYAGNVRF